MTAAGIREYGRRLVVLLMAIAGLSLFGLSVVGAIGLLVLAIVVYVAPQARRPEGVLAYSRMTAVVMPDLLGYASSKSAFDLLARFEDGGFTAEVPA